uniref:Coiled-coil domain-containing protein 13 n=1 Tax=Lygus hesperus TaxID=30085 RepID=A0A0K8SXC5_LYGHE
MASQQMNGNAEENDNHTNDNENDLEREQQLKELTDKLNIANNKLCESRNQMQSLKQELKVVQKALVNEVGDEASAVNILAGNANTWRGRAQQILSLQQKVAELQSKLSATDLIGKEKSALSIAISEKHAEREKVAALTKELEVLKEELADFTNKGEAAKARIKVLSTDLNSNKVVLQSLQTKNANDEQTISKLTSQLAGLMEKAQERENNITRQLNNRIDEMSKELRQVSTRILGNWVEKTDNNKRSSKISYL